MADAKTNSADGYFKEDLDIEVGSFSLDMLDGIHTEEDTEDEVIVDVIKSKKSLREEEDED